MLEQIGPYAVVRTLAAGGMGVIYQATEPRTGRWVAVKTVRVVSRAHLAALRTEIRTLRRLRHPALARLLSDGVQDGVPWYAMPLLEGPTLRQYLKQVWGEGSPEAEAATEPTLVPLLEQVAEPAAGPAASRRARRAAGGQLNEVLTLARQLCVPLLYLHRRGMVHGDLKPRNIILSQDRAPILVDFGMISHFSSPEGRLELQTQLSRGGTAPYLAPELLRGAMPDPRTDIFAFGVILYQAICGILPFSARVTRDMVLDEDVQAPPRPSLLVDGIEPRLDALIAQMLAPRPETRIGDVADVAVELQELLSQSASSSQASLRPPRLQRPAMVGRQLELERLLEATERARAGSGQCIVLIGEGGIGKTTLLHELVQRARSMGVGLAVGKGDAGLVGSGSRQTNPAWTSAAAPLSTLSELLLQISDRALEANEPGGALEPAQSELGIVAQFNAELAENLGLAPRRDESLASEAAQQNLFAAIRGLLAKLCADSPFVLIVDDLQWTDSLSLAVLQTLTQSFVAQHALLIVAAYRGEANRPGVDALLASEHCQSLPLGRLDSALSQRLIEAAVPSGAVVSAELLSFLDSRAQGNPLFLWECLRVGLAERWIVFEQAAWGLTRSRPGEASFLPSSAELLLKESFQALAASELELAEAAAVIGREFSEADLTLLLGPAAEGLQSGLRALRRALMIEGIAPARFQFRHDKLRELAYARCPEAKRRELHRRLAEGLQARAASAQAPVRLASLAQHFEAGGDLEQAAELWLDAGAEAAAGWVFQDAVPYLAHGLELAEGQKLGSPQERARWYRELGDAFQGLGDVVQGRAHLERAAQLLGQPLPAPSQALWRVPGELCRLLGEALSLRFREPAPEPLANEGVRVCDRLLQIYYHAAEDELMLFTTLRGLRLAGKSQAIPEQTTAFANGAAVAGLIPLRGVTERLLAKARGSAAVHGQRAAESYIRMQSGMYRLGLGDLQRAVRDVQRSRELGAQLGFSRRVEECGIILATIALVAGHFAEAREHYEEVLHSAVARGDRQTRCWALTGRSVAAVRSGFSSDNLADLDEASQLAATLGRGDRLWTDGVRALAHLERGDFVEASAAADAAEREMDQGPPLIPSWMEPYSHVIEVRQAEYARRSGRRERQAIRRAARRMAGLARVFPLARARAQRLAGLHLIDAGRVLQARSRLLEAADTAARLGLDFDYASAMLALEPPERAGLRQPDAVASALSRCGLSRESVDEQARVRLDPRDSAPLRGAFPDGP